MTLVGFLLFIITLFAAIFRYNILKFFKNETGFSHIYSSWYCVTRVELKIKVCSAGRHYYFIYSGQVELRHSSVDTDDFPALNAGSDFGVSK